MDKIIVPIAEKALEEIEKVEGTIMSVNWNALIPAISDFVRLRPDEVIDGLVVTDVDIRVKISRKKGRKSNGKSNTQKEDGINN